MNDRLENGALAALLVLTLILVGFSLRSRTSEAPAPAGPGTSASPTASPTPSTSTSATSSAKSVVFLGDSVAEGKSATAPAKRWTRIVAAELGLTEVNLGHARTGYIRMGPEGSCGETACPNFEGVAAEVARAEPKAIVVTGGGNDSGQPADKFAEAVTDTLTDLKKAAPGATIYVVNPWWDLRPVPDSLTEQTSVVQTAAVKAGVVYLDTKQPLVDEPDLMVASGTNPNDAGHAILAKAVADAIARSG